MPYSLSSLAESSLSRQEKYACSRLVCVCSALAPQNAYRNAVAICQNSIFPTITFFTTFYFCDS